MSPSYFAGCTVLVTGASAGIGREFARQLAPVVGSMILVARRADRLEALELELKVINPALEIFYRALDLRNHDDLGKFCDWLEESGLTVDILINNAGLGDRGRFIDSDWDKINSMLRVNIEALTYLTYRILPSMRKSGCGAILNVSSVAGFLPVPSLAVYAASKAYVTSFSEALRAELRSSNISVTVLCPGQVPTEFDSVAARPGVERRVSQGSRTPRPRKSRGLLTVFVIVSLVLFGCLVLVVGLGVAAVVFGGQYMAIAAPVAAKDFDLAEPHDPLDQVTASIGPGFPIPPQQWATTVFRTDAAVAEPKYGDPGTMTLTTGTSMSGRV